MSNKLPFNGYPRLKELRIENKYTQEYVAEKLDITVKTYRSWEIGYYDKSNTHLFPKIDSDNLIKLSDLYHVSIDYILLRSNQTTVNNDLIHKETGLEEKTINELRKAHAESDKAFLKQQNYIELINFLFEHEKTKTLMQHMYYYFFGNFKYVGTDYSPSIDLTDDYCNGIAISVNDIRAWFLQIITTGMISIYEKIVEPNSENYKYYGKNIPSEAELQDKITYSEKRIKENKQIIKELSSHNINSDQFMADYIQAVNRLTQLVKTKDKLYSSKSEKE